MFMTVSDPFPRLLGVGFCMATVQDIGPRSGCNRDLVVADRPFREAHLGTHTAYGSTTTII
jgi:hypothetical protein